MEAIATKTLLPHWVVGDRILINNEDGQRLMDEGFLRELTSEEINNDKLQYSK